MFFQVCFLRFRILFFFGNDDVDSLGILDRFIELCM